MVDVVVTAFNLGLSLASPLSKAGLIAVRHEQVNVHQGHEHWLSGVTTGTPLSLSPASLGFALDGGGASSVSPATSGPQVPNFADITVPATGTDSGVEKQSRADIFGTNAARQSVLSRRTELRELSHKRSSESDAHHGKTIRWSCACEAGVSIYAPV